MAAPGGRRMALADATATAPRGAGKSKNGLFWDLFIPSVPDLPEEYLLFQGLDCLQAACSYLRGVLTLHSTLTGAGIDSNDASSAAAAVLAFILKDGSGHIGSLLSSYFLSDWLDGEVKYFRLLADLANDVGLTLELFAPVFGKQYFLSVTCLANVCKALCGVAAGGTRVAISQHFAGRSGNVASVAAKEGAQETAVTLIGLLLGYYCSKTLNSSQTLQWSAFAVLTVVHVVANYWAVKALRLTNINRSRAYLLADSALLQMPEGVKPRRGRGSLALPASPPASPSSAASSSSSAGVVHRSSSGSTPKSPGGSSPVRPPFCLSPGGWTWDAPTPRSIATVEPVLLPVHYGGAVLRWLGPLVAQPLCSLVHALGGRLLAEGSSVGVFDARAGTTSRFPAVHLCLGTSVQARPATASATAARAVGILCRSTDGAGNDCFQFHDADDVPLAMDAPPLDFVAVCVSPAGAAKHPGCAWRVAVTASEGVSPVTRLLGYMAAVRLAHHLHAASATPEREGRPALALLLARACEEVAASAGPILHGLARAGWDLDSVRLDEEEGHRAAVVAATSPRIYSAAAAGDAPAHRPTTALAPGGRKRAASSRAGL